MTRRPDPSLRTRDFGARNRERTSAAAGSSCASICCEKPVCVGAGRGATDRRVRFCAGELLSHRRFDEAFFCLGFFLGSWTHWDGFCAPKSQIMTVARSSGSGTLSPTIDTSSRRAAKLTSRGPEASICARNRRRSFSAALALGGQLRRFLALREPLMRNSVTQGQ